MSDRVTDEQAAAWRALCDAATPGPWYATQEPTEQGAPEWWIIDAAPARGIETEIAELTRKHARQDDNARFIAAAPVAVRALLDERAVQEQRSDEAKAALDRISLRVAADVPSDRLRCNDDLATIRRALERSG